MAPLNGLLNLPFLILLVESNTPVAHEFVSLRRNKDMKIIAIAEPILNTWIFPILVRNIKYDFILNYRHTWTIVSQQYNKIIDFLCMQILIFFIINWVLQTKFTTPSRPHSRQEVPIENENKFFYIILTYSELKPTF